MIPALHLLRGILRFALLANLIYWFTIGIFHIVVGTIGLVRDGYRWAARKINRRLEIWRLRNAHRAGLLVDSRFSHPTVH